MLNTDTNIKLCLLGSNDIEILSFIKKISPPLFDLNSIQTIGADFYAKRLNFTINDQQFEIKIHFWVLSSNERFKFLIPSYFRDSDGFVILLNLSEIESYHYVKYWISLIRERFLQDPILLIGYSTNEEKISTDLIDNLITEHGIKYIKLSFENDIEVESSIILLACIILDLQIPHDVKQILDLYPLILSFPHPGKDKGEITRYSKVTPSIELYKYSYIESLKNISTILDNPNLQKIEPHLERLKEYIDVQEKKINSMKGRFLEMNTRLLFEKQYGYKVNYTGKDLECTPNEIEVLYNNRCIKSHETKDIEIDIFGKKTNYESDFTYLIGECKDRNKKISLKEINCFLIKARIIAQFYLYIHQREKKSLPKFHLVIISIHGFSGKQKINKILEDIWHSNIPKKRIFNESIDLIAKKEFLDLLKKNSIPISNYKE